MQSTVEADPVLSFLGSVAQFAAAAGRVLDDEPLRQVSRGRLTHSQLRVLEHVAAAEGHNIGDAAADLRVSYAAASKAVDKLVRRRLLRRTEAEGDRRTSFLTLTDTSRRLLAAIGESRAQRIREIFAQSSIDDLSRAAEVLRRLAAAINNYHAELQPR